MKQEIITLNYNIEYYQDMFEIAHSRHKEIAFVGWEKLYNKIQKYIADEMQKEFNLIMNKND